MMMGKGGLPEELKPTPNANDNYVNVDTMLPRGSEMLGVQVTGSKRDIDGNTAGRVSYNPILDTREYTVQFEYIEVTELTANVISKSMYAKCDPDGNQYILLYDIIYFRKTNSALSKYCSESKSVSASHDCWMASILSIERRIYILGKV